MAIAVVLIFMMVMALLGGTVYSVYRWILPEWLKQFIMGDLYEQR